MTIVKRMSAALFALLSYFIFMGTPQALETKRILVLSAASAAPAVQYLARQAADRSGSKIRVSIGSSGTLARQIMQGAPADIYISAATDWIDTLVTAESLEPGKIRPLVRNRLVFVASVRSPETSLLDLTKPVDVLNRLSGGRLAIGDPAHVPAGRYAQEALEHLGLWPAVRDRLARQANVRAVLAMVERGETPLGVIYATDATLSDRVRLAAIVPAEAHPPIAYTAAIIKNRDRPEVSDFYNTLFSSEGHDVFERFGFAIEHPETPIQSSSTAPSMR